MSIFNPAEIDGLAAARRGDCEARPTTAFGTGPSRNGRARNRWRRRNRPKRIYVPAKKFRNTSLCDGQDPVSTFHIYRWCSSLDVATSIPFWRVARLNAARIFSFESGRAERGTRSADPDANCSTSLSSCVTIRLCFPSRALGTSSWRTD